MIGGFFTRESLRNARNALRQAELAAVDGDVRAFQLAVAELNDAAYRLACVANHALAERRESADAG